MKERWVLRGSLALSACLCLATAFGQKVSVSGTVTDGATGEAMWGVTVLEKGTSNGLITDDNGKYALSVESGATLVFSFVSYRSQEIAAGSGGVIDVLMKVDDQLLDEVVVVGYGVQKKSVVTASISRVSSDELNLVKSSRVEDVLKGKVSGVQITQSSGQPGADSKIRIRGIGTVNNSEPLFIVDGMPVDGGINYLNPEDIQSIEILKDAAGAAIYGARAANGVILVTTKMGEKGGKASVNYNFSYGWQNPWKKKAMLNATDYMVLMNESFINDGDRPKYGAADIASAGTGTDWQDETFYYNAPVVNHQVSVAGGAEKIQYFLSFGYFGQDGIVGGNTGKSNYDRWSLRTNSVYTVFEESGRSFLNRLRVGVNAGYTRTVSTGIETNSEYGSILGSALSFDPTLPVYAGENEVEQILQDHPAAVRDADGRVFTIPPGGFQEIANPVAMLHQRRSEKDNTDKFVATFWGEIDLLPGLTFKSSYGTDLAFWGKDGYEFPYFLATQGKNMDQSSVWGEMNRGYKWQAENVLTWTKAFEGGHNVSVVAGQSAQRYTLRQIGGTDYDLPEEDPIKANINSAIADRDKERLYGGLNDIDLDLAAVDHTSLASYFGRVDYNYAERYMVEATVRRDGSSRFGPRNKWAVFPAVSLGWNVLNEPYIERPEWFDVLKVRFSWGKNGNENIGNLRYAALLNGGQNYYFGGGYNVADDSKSGVMQDGSFLAALPNADLRWEESVQTNIGIDARFFHSSLTLGLDYFVKTTNGMLMAVPIPDYVGIGAPTGNVGDMENRGVELELGYKGSVSDFNYAVNANASYLKNKLVKLGNASGEMIYEDAGASGVGAFIKGKNGEVWPYFYGRITDGIFQNQAEVDAYVNAKGEKMQPKALPGDVRFVDIDGNGIIDDEDRTKIGKGMPDVTFGLTLSGDWRGFDASLFFQGTAGNDIFDFAQRGDIRDMNRPTWILDRWHGEGTSDRLPRMTRSNPNGNWVSSDLYIKDGSYVRLKSVQLGYTLPAQLTRKASVQRLRLFVAAENLLTFTGYDGFDPEVATGDYDRIGVDRGVYPQSRTISAGVNITF
ncbi:MAG: TonB-dependent receptor [Tannerellaceae bacterium]|jgi:TonB-linked SusC/RagA family outer membrane protein|nr:TonB-dependent receptor [Tannerellaceae bacterium]